MLCNYGLCCKSLRTNHYLQSLANCEFRLTSIESLGHIISSNSTEVDPKKLNAVRRLPRPPYP